MTFFTSSNTLATVYGREIEREWFARSYFARMLGALPTSETPDLGIPLAGPYTPIVMKAELLRNPGQTISIPYFAALAATATTDNLTSSDLEGNETALTDSAVTITPAERGKAVAWRNRIQRQVNYEMMDAARVLLGGWAAQKLDVDIIEIAEANTTNVVFSGNAASRDEIDTSDTLAPVDFQKAVAKMKFVDAQIPGGEGGGFIALVHPYAAYQLKRASDWTNYHQYAGVRGNENPLFRHPNLIGWIDDVAIFETTLISRANNSNSPAVSVAKNLVLSARCLAVAALMGEVAGDSFGKVWDWRTRSQTDYGRSLGVGIIADYEAKLLTDKYITRIQ